MKKKEIIAQLEKRVEALENALLKNIAGRDVNTEPVRKELKLEPGKWYKHNCGSIAYLGNEDIFSYGLSIYDSEGNMSDTLHWIDYEWDVKYSSKGWTKATPQEVEEALVKEAKRRGYKSGVTAIFGSGRDQRTISSDSITWEAWNDTMALSMGCDVIFRQDTGKWAEIIEQPVDKFAELKKAERNGKNIECRIKNFTSVWVEKTHEGFFYNFEYRIKPKEKPKVGDVVKAWCRNEEHYVVGNLTDISTGTENKYGVHILGVSALRNTIYYANAKPLTKEEAIDLLFNDGKAKKM